MTAEDVTPCLYLDHDIDARLADALRRHRFDIVTTIEIGMQEASDRSQLAYAADNHRIFVTHNIRHFPGIHLAWIQEGQHHSGIVVLAGYPPIGVWLERVRTLFSLLSPNDLHDQLLFLGAEFD